MISVETKITIVGLLILAWAASLIGVGIKYHHKGIEEQKVLDAKAVQKVIPKQEAITTKVITKYIPQIQKIQGDTVTIIKRIPFYVTKKDDSACVIPNGFVSLWNAANSMQVPASASSLDATASGVILSDVEAEHAAEASSQHQTEVQLEALQDWIRRQQKVNQ